jgi:hypothetical protein
MRAQDQIKQQENFEKSIINSEILIFHIRPYLEQRSYLALKLDSLKYIERGYTADALKHQIEQCNNEIKSLLGLNTI